MMDAPHGVPGKSVLLLFPPMRDFLYGEKWRSTESPTAPLGLMYLATPLIRAGFSVRFVDLTVDRLSRNDYFRAFRNSDFILISCYSQALVNILKIIQDARAIHAEAYIICGGPHCNETQVHVDGSDLTVYGEADQVIAVLLDRISSSRPLDDLPGISYRQNGRLIKNPGFHTIQDLDSIEPPSFDLARNKKYGYIYGVKVNKMAGIITSRGCPYECTFCTFRRVKYRERAVDRVVKEIEQRAAEGAKFLIIFDDNFLMRRQRVVEIAEEIIKKRIRLKIALQGRVDFVDDRLLKKLREAGVIILLLGVESGNQDVLDFYKKDINVEQARRAITQANQFGIITFGTFIVGAPMENLSHFEANKRFFKEAPLDLVSIHVLDYVCGSRLWDDAYKKGLLQKNEILVAADKRLSNFTTEELIRVQKDLIKSFYNNPKRIARLVVKFFRILGGRFVFSLIKMFFYGTIYRSSNTFHGSVTKNVRL